jgi:hypothetical protein
LTGRHAPPERGLLPKSEAIQRVGLDIEDVRDMSVPDFGGRSESNALR